MDTKEITKETTENKEVTNNYVITDEGKKHILGIISKKPFSEVLGIAQLLEKPVLTEVESNSIIQKLSQFNYGEVSPFFAKIKDYFTLKNQDTEINVNESVDESEGK